MTDKGVVIKIMKETNIKFRKQIVMVKFNSSEMAGIEFHHANVDKLKDLNIGDFVEVEYLTKARIAGEHLYNNLIGQNIRKL